MIRRKFMLAAALALVASTQAGHAATQSPFDQAAFDAARTANKPIVIAVHADWCPVCVKQAPIITSLAASPEFKDLVILVVDFDKQKDVVKALRVDRQSTLIALRGAAEKDRAVGISTEDAIKTLFQKTAG